MSTYTTLKKLLKKTADLCINSEEKEIVAWIRESETHLKRISTKFDKVGDGLQKILKMIEAYQKGEKHWWEQS
jgi:GTP-binding protein EngB required for normal cell division